MPVQTVLIPDDWELSRAIEWLDKHNYIHSKIRHEGNYFRFRQKLPSKTQRYTATKLNNGILIISQY